MTPNVAFAMHITPKYDWNGKYHTSGWFTDIYANISTGKFENYATYVTLYVWKDANNMHDSPHGGNIQS